MAAPPLEFLDGQYISTYLIFGHELRRNHRGIRKYTKKDFCTVGTIDQQSRNLYKPKFKILKFGDVKSLEIETVVILPR